MEPSPLRYRVASRAEVTAAGESSTELRVGFEALGFHRLESIVVVPDDARILDALASRYDPESAALFRRHSRTPETVLVDSDHTAFARISWFWGNPCMALMTLLSNGTLLETRAAWTTDPPWPVRLSASKWRMDPVREQLLDAGPGRDIQLVPSDAPADLWHAHRSRLTASGVAGAVGLRHETAEQLAMLATAAYDAAWRSSERARLADGTSWGVVLCIAALVGWLAGRAAGGLLAGVLAGAAVLALAAPLLRRLPWYLRHAPWLRARFRAPRALRA